MFITDERLRRVLLGLLLQHYFKRFRGPILEIEIDRISRRFRPRAIVLHRTIRSLKHDDRQLDVVARSQGWLNQVLVAGEARPTVGEAVTVLAVLEGLAVGKDIQPSPTTSL